MGEVGIEMVGYPSIRALNPHCLVISNLRHWLYLLDRFFSDIICQMLLAFVSLFRLILCIEFPKIFFLSDLFMAYRLAYVEYLEVRQILVYGHLAGSLHDGDRSVRAPR